MIFNLVKELFSWNECLRRSVIFLVGSIGKLFWSSWFAKRVLYMLSNLALKKYYWTISRKVIFSLVKDLFKWIEGLRSSVIVLLGSKKDLTWGALQKKSFIRCQISRLKSMLVQFHKKLFSIKSRTFPNELTAYVRVS